MAMSRVESLFMKFTNCPHVGTSLIGVSVDLPSLTLSHIPYCEIQLRYTLIAEKEELALHQIYWDHNEVCVQPSGQSTTYAKDFVKTCPGP